MIIAYFDCFSGISGDMTLGALVDLGLDSELLKNELAKLKLEGYKISFDRTEKHGIAGTKIHVELTNHADHDHHHSRNLNDICQLIEASDLSGDVKAKSIAIFVRLGEAEARVHGTTIDKVHFHEVGAVDSIVDIVGSVIGITALGIEKIYSSSLSLGRGFARSSHGIIPIPAPATLELLKDIPVRRTEIESELVTPTGAAIISTLADGFGPAPEMVVEKIGYGAGGRDLAEQPNLLRISLGTAKYNYESDTVKVIETNIDDMSPQIYDLLIDKLLGMGALDVFLTPIVMKKSRPAVMLTALVDSPHLQEVCDCILTETTTLGVRIYEADRKKLSREIIEVETEYGKVRVKLGKIGDQVIKILPEYEDCKRLAKEKNVPIMKIQQATLKKFRIEDCRLG
jgi:uncharacterized protein (TIGR00299 family) protein